MEEALEDDNVAWYITFNPKTALYTLQNVGSGQYIGVSNGQLKAQTTSAPIQLMPSREKSTFSKQKIHSFWITSNKGAYALRANTATGVGTATYDNSAGAVQQRWFLLDNEQLSAYDNAKRIVLQRELSTLVKEVRKVFETPHEGKSESTNLTETDDKMESLILEVETAISGGSYTTAAQVSNANTALLNGLVSFLSNVRPTQVSVPFELTFLLQNPGITSNEGWSTAFTYQNNVGEMFTANAFTISQTTSLKLPIGTYQVRAQAFQRAGSYADAYPKYQEGMEDIKGSLFLKGKATKLKSIFDDAQPRTMGTGSVDANNGVFIPNTIQSAYNYFRRGYYSNEVVAENVAQSTLTLGIRSTAATEVIGPASIISSCSTSATTPATPLRASGPSKQDRPCRKAPSMTSADAAPQSPNEAYTFKTERNTLDNNSSTAMSSKSEPPDLELMLYCSQNDKLCLTQL